MLSYMLPTDDKPPPDNRNGSVNQIPRHGYNQINDIQTGGPGSPKMTLNARAINALQSTLASRGGNEHIDDIDEADEVDQTVKQYVGINGRKGSNETFIDNLKHYDITGNSNTTTNANSTTTTAAAAAAGRKSSALYTGPGRAVVKDDSLYSIGSDASTVGSEKKHKLFNGAKHASLKRVSFGSSKGSMVETLVYETPVQEEPETNHFLDHNGRLPGPITFGSPLLLAPETDEGRERVRVSLLEPTPCPSTPGVLLLEPTPDLDEHLPHRTMATSPAELLTAHTEHTTPTYHTQISTDSGWDNPFRPDGDLSREADEIVELIKGGKPITPTPGQNAPALPGVESTTPVTSAAVLPSTGVGGDLDSGTSPLLNSNVNVNQQNSPRLNYGNGNANSNSNSNPNANANSNANANATPIKGSANTGNNQHTAHEKVATSVNAATVEVGRVTAQGPGDASQVEHVTLKKKPKCKCCVLQ